MYYVILDIIMYINLSLHDKELQHILKYIF